MKTQWLLIAAVISAAANVPSLAGSETSGAHPSWMEGCWQHESGTTRESWQRGFDGLLFGQSVTIKDGKLTFFEDIRIERVDRSLRYVVSPGGGAPVTFKATQQSLSSITFENPSHDFPQRIHYEVSETGIAAHISDTEGGNRMDFPMRSVACT